MLPHSEPWKVFHKRSSDTSSEVLTRPRCKAGASKSKSNVINSQNSFWGWMRNDWEVEYNGSNGMRSHNVRVARCQAPLEWLFNPSHSQQSRIASLNSHILTSHKSFVVKNQNSVRMKQQQQANLWFLASSFLTLRNSSLALTYELWNWD